MPAFNLLPFQKTAIDDLNEAFLRLWKKQDRQLPLVFKSPTGSGKTLTIAHFIRGLNHLPQWKIDKAFVWITFSDDLAMQSKDKFKEYFENNLENALLTVNDINRGKLYENDILFLNWQKVVQDNAPEEHYRNRFLATAMFNLKMVDTAGGGIRKMFNKKSPGKLSKSQYTNFFPNKS